MGFKQIGMKTKKDMGYNLQFYLEPKKINAQSLKNIIERKIKNGDFDTWEFEDLNTKIVHCSNSGQDWSKYGFLTLNIDEEGLEVKFNKKNYKSGSKSHILGRFAGALFNNVGDNIKSICMFNE